jgi:hypothetical protein
MFVPLTLTEHTGQQLEKQLATQSGSNWLGATGSRRFQHNT